FTGLSVYNAKVGTVQHQGFKKCVDNLIFIDAIIVRREGNILYAPKFSAFRNYEYGAFHFGNYFGRVASNLSIANIGSPFRTHQYIVNFLFHYLFSDGLNQGNIFMYTIKFMKRV